MPASAQRQMGLRFALVRSMSIQVTFRTYCLTSWWCCLGPLVPISTY